MSVLIKEMEMPKSCDECELCTCYVREDGTEENYRCVITFYPIHEFNERHEYCPLVEVPPHGRLIDADALEDRCSRQARDEWNKSTGTNWGYAYATFESDVEDAPTIIESEEKDERTD